MPAKGRPVIAVTGPDRGGFVAWIFTRWALSRAGARAVRVTPRRQIDARVLQGLVLGGGADVSEPLVPEAPAPPPSRVRWPRRMLDRLLAPLVLVVRWLFSTRAHGVDRARDALELELLTYAREQVLPVLGICRGAQLMALAEGGTLLRDVNTLYGERPALYTVLPRREIAIAPGSLLERVLGRHELLVNSLHFHAIGEPALGMRVVAREPSGVPQAIEHGARPFWLGVQWHPEYLPQQAVHQRLFVALAEAASARAESHHAEARHEPRHAAL